MSHECKRFRTVSKHGGVRLTVACRECGRVVKTREALEIEARIEAETNRMFSEDMEALCHNNVA
jgi:adenylate cyclase class IV